MGVVGGVVGVVGVTVLLAVQLAVVPLLDPAQVQVQGPVPATVETVPVVQRLVVGMVATVVLWDGPQVPFRGVVGAFGVVVATGGVVGVGVGAGVGVVGTKSGIMAPD